MNTARKSRIETDAVIGGAPRRAVAPSRHPTPQEALLSAANRIKNTLGEASAQLERLEDRFDSPAGLRLPVAPVPKPRTAPGIAAGAVASAEARVQMALRSVLVALRDMGLPRSVTAR